MSIFLAAEITPRYNVVMLYTTCTTCNGTKQLSTGREIGPFESQDTKECPDCDGTGKEAVRCEMCNEHASVEAWVINGLPGLLRDGNDGRRVAVRMFLCSACFEADETEIVIQGMVR